MSLELKKLKGINGTMNTKNRKLMLCLSIKKILWLVLALFLFHTVTPDAKAADADDKPLSYYRYYNDCVKLLPMSDKGVSGDDILKQAKNFKLVRTRPEAVFVSDLIPEADDKIEYREIPVELLEEASVDRTAFIRFGFPLPEGILYDLKHIKVSAPNGEDVNAQFSATAFWKDKSLKWVLVTFSTLLKADEKKIFKVVYGSGVMQKNIESKLKLTETADELTISTGILSATIDKKHFNLLKKVWIDRNKDGIFSEDETVGGFDKAGIKLADEKMNLFCSAGTAPRKIQIEEAGPEQIVLAVTGEYVSSENNTPATLMSYETKLIFTNNSPLIEISIRTIDSHLKTEFCDISGISTTFQPATEITALKAALLSKIPTEINHPVIIGSSRSFFQMNDEALSIDGRKSTDEKLTGLFVADTFKKPICFTIRDYWQRWPKTVSANEKAMTIDILPVLPDSDFGKELPHYLQFNLCQGKYRFKWGMSFTERIGFDFSGEINPKAVEAEMNMPAVAVLPLDYYVETKVFPSVAGSKGLQFKEWDKYVENSFASYMNLKKAQREYGFLNYGDSFGERNVNWTNNEYDMAHGLFMDFIRTGNRSHFRWAMIAANHQADVDMVNVYPNPYYIGANVQHSIGHTGQRSEGSNHATWTHAYDGRTGATNGHTWCGGLIDAWCLAGDRRAMDAAYGLGEHITWAIAPNLKTVNTVERGPGWALKSIMTLYRLTYNAEYLAAADKIAGIAMKEQRFDKGGAWPHILPKGHTFGEENIEGNCHFYVAILLSSLRDYHEITQKPEVAKSIVAGAAWQAACCDAGKWPYSSSVDGVPCGTLLPSDLNVLIASSIAYAGIISKNKKMLDVAAIAFIMKTLAGSVCSSGKELALSTVFAAELMGDIQQGYQEYAHGECKSLFSPESIRNYSQLFSNPSKFNIRGPKQKIFVARINNENAEIKFKKQKYVTKSGSNTQDNILIKLPNGEIAFEASPAPITACYRPNAEKGELIKIEINDDMTNICNVSSADADIFAEVLPGFRMGATGLSRFYFSVPKETKEFSIEIEEQNFHSGGYECIIIQPDNKINESIIGNNPYSSKKEGNAQNPSLNVKVPEEMDGKNWSIIILATRDFSFHLKGIPPFISCKNIEMSIK